MTNVFTIPKNLVLKDDLVIIPRADYEEYLELKKIIPVIKLSKSEKKAVESGRRQIKRGEYINLKGLKNELENRNR